MRTVGASLFLGLVISSILVIACAHASDSGVAYIDACAASLVPTDVRYSSNDVVKLSLLDEMLSNDSNKQNMNTNGQAYAGVFSGGLQGATDEEKSLRQSMNYQLDHTRQLSLIASYLSPVAGDAFDECVKTTFSKPGMHLSVDYSDATTSKIAVEYIPNPNNTLSYKLVMSSNGHITSPSYDVPAGGLTNPLRITAVRSNQARDLTITVSIVTIPDRQHPRGLPQASEDMIIPPITQTRSVTSGNWKATNVVEADCYNSVVYVNTDDVTPDSGYLFLTDDKHVIGEVVSTGKPYGIAPQASVTAKVITETLATGVVSCAYAEGHFNAWYNVKGRLIVWQQKTTTKVIFPHNNRRRPVERTFRS